jgi:hypothetical protein
MFTVHPISQPTSNFISLIFLLFTWCEPCGCIFISICNLIIRFQTQWWQNLFVLLLITLHLGNKILYTKQWQRYTDQTMTKIPTPNNDKDTQTKQWQRYPHQTMTKIPTPNNDKDTHTKQWQRYPDVAFYAHYWRPQCDCKM